MFVARVLRTVVSTEKHSILKGEKLLLVRPIRESGELCGKTLLAIDKVQAGVGDKVLVLQEGSGARLIFNVSSEPVHCIIVGIIDNVDIKEDCK